jgi:large subunit ribosomal protein L24
MKLKVNDTVKIIAGNDKGQTGKIIKVFNKERKITVEGIASYKKHVKPTNDQQGGVITLNRPIPVSNAMLVCPNCKKTTKVVYSGAGVNKVRVCKKCQKPITTQVEKAKK